MDRTMRQDFADRMHTLLEVWAASEDDARSKAYLVVIDGAINAAIALPLEQILSDDEK